ncbi:exosortase system-associated protein, TIGR04073 family [Kiritimatiella glycovorans]|uniref:Putative exosortase-associated protein n=1 Tax=Kiritimatiella glycovorans TaxID=1307763 RepID=A0A0G3EDX2_9BACT|nr:exosortase system-associated protein, TIGR04073 family [Kiritimatiella glycovorans]AKJ64508.1 putative exosortase-associated protein [Kiritimatiella glycovorans]
MRSRKWMVALVVFVAVGVADANAGYMEKIMRKLGRGVANVASSPIELLSNMQDVTEDSGLLAGLTYGTVRGVGHGVARIGVGAAEILSFYVPSEPVIHPEFVMDPDTSEEYEWEVGPGDME